ncbi:hypothetical protein HV461_16570 [Bacillus sporothermodurans]|uniref:hypothetical protein n=1 Tax=Heyndrickxia sporothermodurans TaxID=46224 RepID=UPI000AAC7841|nr:hypothetical protein [Heyndrickxia sporothermodurans]MBL5769003.1 hypothetical protein [Heyndrickxia sporothermodurans]MBL5772783.1 hypothetical protein [Heyndrickxia sporothermodurans]MBL5812220.1 hypothetical protein [Heyndrickxia sporothermodurans]MBL5833257.1 hypothetical protein [Heyndrickxia sporothermodurans]MBL5851552.1 hypothetical protein [Heyndrickxia sporothermodurans]
MKRHKNNSINKNLLERLEIQGKGLDERFENLTRNIKRDLISKKQLAAPYTSFGPVLLTYTI